MKTLKKVTDFKIESLEWEIKMIRENFVNDKNAEPYFQRIEIHLNDIKKLLEEVK